MEALRLLTRTEGIMPAIESAHAVAGAARIAKDITRPDGQQPIIVINISGRGDKDVDTAIRWFGLDGSADEVAGRMEPAREQEKA